MSTEKYLQFKSWHHTNGLSETYRDNYDNVFPPRRRDYDTEETYRAARAKWYAERNEKDPEDVDT